MNTQVEDYIKSIHNEYFKINYLAKLSGDNNYDKDIERELEEGLLSLERARMLLKLRKDS